VGELIKTDVANIVGPGVIAVARKSAAVVSGPKNWGSGRKSSGSARAAEPTPTPAQIAGQEIGEDGGPSQIERKNPAILPAIMLAGNIRKVFFSDILTDRIFLH
jgi:hypothetical protein